jgi:hypothetical protein
MFFACTTQPTDKNENRILPEFNEQTSTVEIKVNTAYPFGCAKLDYIKYPHHWDEDRDHYGRLKSPEGQELADISTFLSGLHNAQTMTGPKVDSIEFLNLNEQYKNDSYYFDTIAVKSLDICLYRLPNFGKYECYYYRQVSKKITYGVYGSLLLLDPNTRIGKLLTLYFEYGGDQHVNLRYYLIDKNTIKLYDGSCYDDGTTLWESFNVRVSDDGIIQVKKFER